MQNSYVIKNVNVLPMTENTVLKNMDITIENGKITAVENTHDNHKLNTVKDYENMFVMPALWDMHFHIFFEDYLDFALSYGVTTVFNLQGWPCVLKWREQMKAGKRIGADIYTSGCIIDGIEDSLGMGFVVAKTKQEARDAVIACKNEGYDFIKIYNNLTPECYEEIYKTAKEIGIRVVGHLPNCVNSDYTGENKDYKILQETIEHGLFLNENNVMQAVEQGVWVDPTFVTEYSFRGIISEESKKEQAKYIRPFIRNFIWTNGRKSHKTPQKGKKKTVRKPLEHGQAMFRQFVEAGGKVLIGTDSGFIEVMPGFAMHEELQYVTEQGMSNYEALRSATALPAEFLKADDCGTVEAGKQAQLIIMKENPLENITATRNLQAVIKREQFYTIHDLLKMRIKKKPLFLLESPILKAMPNMMLNMVKKNIQQKKAGKA